MSLSDKKTMLVRVHDQLAISDRELRVRPQQRQMMGRALSLFEARRVGIVEAPTGTGKSLGYLLPGLITALSEQRKLIVSTATASLQDQLANIDLPWLLQAFEACGYSQISCAMAKGRERHVCPIKLQALTGTNDMFEQDEDRQLESMAIAFDAGKWSGLRDDLVDPVSNTQWARVSNTSASCSGKSCPEVEGCPYYMAQERLKQADVIITNHDYLLTTLARRPQSILGDPEAIYVFDEAHHLNAKLTSAFARKIEFAKLPLELIKGILPFCSAQRAKLESGLQILIWQWSSTEHAVATLLGDEHQFRFPMGTAEPVLKQLCLDLGGALLTLIDALQEGKDAIQSSFKGSRRGGAQDILLQVGQTRIGQALGELRQAHETVTEFAGDETMARWLKRSSEGVMLCACPFDAAVKARQHLWPIVKCALLTSATITSLGAFDPVLRELGLPKDTPCLKLTSPFDMSRVRLVVPKSAVEAGEKLHPRLVKAFVMDKAMRAMEHVGVLVYFTSRRLMMDVFDAIAPDERTSVLLQGQWQPSALLVEHRRRIDAGLRSIIFGLDSMGEGVDLPGAYCTRVVITRLPFPSPDDPVIATHGEHLTEKGLDAFGLLTLPKAGLKLAQVCGRLMRREGDSGDILVLDRRLVSKRYGRRMLKSTQFTEVLS